MKWYHAWRENARKQWRSGRYYRKHDRMPNVIVQSLYSIGYFFGDFVPLVLNLIEGVYGTIRRLLTFVSKLMIDASTGIILVGTICFSVFHSIELLRDLGATGGQEYIGVLMFEVVFISSTATLTGMLMNGKKINFKGIGFVFSLAGFIVGTFFVLWSNISGMGSSIGGRTIGILTPILLIISEGLIAYRYSDEIKEDETQVMEIIQRNELSVGEVMKAIEMYLVNTRKMEWESQKISSHREGQKWEESLLENLETSHQETGKLETTSENPPTQKRDTSRLENPPTKNLEVGELEESSELEGGELEEKLETPKLEEMELEDVELETSKELEEMNLEEQETGELEKGKLEEKPEESITNWKLKTLQPALEKQVEPAPLKASVQEGEPLEDQKTSKLEDGKREAGELEEPETGDLKKLETSKLEESATGEMETSSLEDLEVETGEQIGELEEKLETPKLKTGESSNLENQKQETSKVEKVEKEEKFTKEDLEHFSREELEAMKGADPEDVAVRILEREGELPGRPRLKRLTGCTEWDARKTLRELKKKQNVS